MSKWNEKIVVVAGGSKGLGLEIAREFGHRQARVVLLASTAESLDNAKTDLRESGIDSEGIQMDARDEASVESAFARIRADIGVTDVLVNCIGKSTRADITKIDMDFHAEMMELNYFCSLRCVKQALPDLLESNGHLVNIGSLASKTAWPFMSPYSAPKFALAALTHQLRMELRHRIHAMLVCPGPIRRSDAGERYSQEAEHLPDSAKQPGAGTRLKGICPTWLAKKIIRGCEKRKSELIVPFKANLLFILSALSTRIGDWFARLNRSSKS